MTKYQIIHFQGATIIEIEETNSAEEVKEMIEVGMNVGMVDSITMMVTDTDGYVYHTESVRVDELTNWWFTITSTDNVMMMA